MPHRNLIGVFALLVALPLGAQTVPFVGCPSDGQLGRQPPPPARTTPTVPAALVSQVAFYAGRYGGVLGPRGWHCYETSGSGGYSVLVAPRELQDLGGGFSGFGAPGQAGDAIVYSVVDGDTSGREVVARIAAMIFPVARSYVATVEDFDSSLGISRTFPSVPPATDLLSRRSDYEVDYVTPPRRDGLGTEFFLIKNNRSIHGVVILQKYAYAQEFGLVALSARLPPELQHLLPAIIAETRKQARVP